MASKNIAVFLDGAKLPHRLAEIPVEEPQENQVLLAMHSVGICGSDIHIWEHGKILGYEVTRPCIIGHESSGTVLKVGPNVTNLKPGDRVAIEPGPSCRNCTACKTGRYNLCENFWFTGIPIFPGTMKRYHVHAADFCHKLPDNVSLEEGALMEPFAVTVHACQRGNVSFGMNLLICGAGPIGILTTIAAKALGVKNVVITDIVDSRLKLAKENGADMAINVSGKEQSEVVEIINKALGSAPDVTIECTGTETSTELGILATKVGGRIVLVGIGSGKISISMADAVTKEIDLIGSLTYPNNFPLAIDMVASGRANIKPIITHRFKIDEINKAFHIFQNRLDNSVKVIIQCYE